MSFKWNNSISSNTHRQDVGRWCRSMKKKIEKEVRYCMQYWSQFSMHALVVNIFILMLFYYWNNHYYDYDCGIRDIATKLSGTMSMRLPMWYWYYYYWYDYCDYIRINNNLVVSKLIFIFGIQVLYIPFRMQNACLCLYSDINIDIFGRILNMAQLHALIRLLSLLLEDEECYMVVSDRFCWYAVSTWQMHMAKWDMFFCFRPTLRT